MKSLYKTITVLMLNVIFIKTPPFGSIKLSGLKFCITLLTLISISSCGKKIPEYIAVQYSELPETIDFNIDVKPILSDKCYACHGPDENSRKANLRFDTESGLFKKSSLGNYAFKPGSIDKSESITRILSQDPTILMPPIESHLELDTKEKAVLIKWIEQGAQWEKHWAFNTPQKPALPTSIPWEPTNEIDQFIYAKLEEKKLQPNKPAAKEQLLRRLSIDLRGIPPSLEELNLFINDTDPMAYEKMVDRMLHSMDHAERLTLEWLDVARYSDSHGYHADGARMMWQWRDWVIDAFYTNKPYNEFVTEQLAGDLLPNATKKQKLATAFNRNHPTTAEGGAIDEEFRVDYVTNRTNTFGTAFLGLTVECAKCHDHKYDPISQKDYFQLFAYFNNIKELGMTSNDGNTGPLLLLTDPKLDSITTQFQSKIDSLETLVKAYKKPFIADASFSDSKKFEKIAPLVHHSFENITTNGKKKILDNNTLTTVSSNLTLAEGIKGKAAVFDNQYDQIAITKLAPFQIADPFSVSVWVYLDKRIPEKTMTVVGNSSVKSELYRGWDIHIDSNGQVSSRLISALPNNYLHVKTNDSIPINEWTHLLMTYDGSKSASGLNIYINGKEKNQSITYSHLYKSMIPNAKGNLIVGKSLRGQTGDNGIFEGKIDELSIYNFEILPLQVATIYTQSKATTIPSAWQPNETDYTALQSHLKQLRNEKLKAIDTVKEIMVMEEMPIQRKTYILQRGEYNMLGPEVERATPSQISENMQEYPKDRLGLSQWLFDSKNPLAARVAVNRYWQLIFGKGLVSTMNDFGNQGSLPSHAKLLDYLAIDFMESGWDLRRLLKKMVLSNTYKQSSKTTKKLREIDPENSLLARAPSYRLQAEFIRDNALKSSGLLNTAVGGKSVKPYQPEGLWIEKGNFSKDLLYFVQDHDDKQYRKSMYTFNKRTSPPPFMEIFDMPAREYCNVFREQTNTPLQALSLLNDPQFVEASKALAYRMKKEGGKSLGSQLEIGFQLALSRKPKSTELKIMRNLYTNEYARFTDNKDKAAEYLSVGDYNPPPDFPIEEMAAMTIVANTLFNMDEMYTKR
ncbi:DUF1553 domain-containing protein [Cellulophaga sp. F20128]|uniref:DUF1553 domain-containing protein n=1 Tax=Cellulophaga sp. F20128 TaxID=2926413 RepID=UPI001FF3C123|nr:DUF1553 domain-containing protein [Cellulophaga sp. F20128]MCK0157609.1 DUF1553 domain-containing protein [Cellulophaga sp. F20128]